jgi:NAD(P)-dependent dehydrogenase (short-subunit alcohol dehydrogenase family)
MSTNGRVAGKAAIVTGAASGIGRATAQVLAREGASVCIADVDADGGRQVADEIAAKGGEAIFVRTDVGVRADVIDMFERIEEAFGRVDIVHNNAIRVRDGAATELDERDWDATLNIGLKAIFLAAKYGIPIMRKTGGGTIINTGSVHSLVSLPTCTAYDAAKAGVLGLTRTLAIDYGPDIRVCAVLPGAILTPAWNGTPEEKRRRYAQMVPAKRLGTGEDVANAVLFLASDEASFITGTALTVDGGLLARTD